ncbi:hypothetical protein IPA_07035 [Ignicoccus pacificus DSM 13166]|uniref:GINS subunit domain-containing protein n=1 Tax=Ignicoccus pacificus DSM 13166 TaxID=940294 RepID=A0A977PL38_9CREN|nr:hypothetical protein IPA_07035 [Ignicoccus pacificus DSM 13166]
MKLELAIDLEMEKFMEEKVKVMILKELVDVFNGEELLRLGKGMEIDLPRWLAEELVARGYAKYSREEDIVKLSKEISKYKFLENKHKDDPYPVQLPKNFYKMVKLIGEKAEELIRRGEFEGNMNDIFSIMNKLMKVKNDVEEIAEIRLLKMMKYVVSSKEVPVELRERCTPEEIHLVNELKYMIDVWYEKVLLTGEER